MKFISDKGLDELKRYQYKSGGYTTIDNLMNDFWFGISERLPLWLAPNLITFLGFLIMVTASACQIYYDTTFTKDIPRWTFWLMAFAIFAYQTLDAVDGKQARRTKSSSPLGQLFDHGCDSFILTFFGLAMAQACKVDKDFFFWVFLNVQLCEWAINQKEHITGILNTNLGNFGVTELEFICVGVEITAAIFGQDLLTKQFFGFVLYKIVFVPILIAAVVANTYMFVTNILSSKNRLETVLEWIPIFLHVSCQFVWFNSNIYSQLAAPILLLFGLILSLITCKVIVCSVTKDKFPLFHVELIPFIIFTLLIQFGNFSYDNNIKIFWSAFFIESLLIFVFLRGVIIQILQHLNIQLFKIARL